VGKEQGRENDRTKWTWYKMMKNNFSESLACNAIGVSMTSRNPPYATRADIFWMPRPMIGKPNKADKLPDYDNADSRIGW
jgi:hypothetical protein